MDGNDDGPDSITELIYGTFITVEECDKLILEKNIYNMEPKMIQHFKSNPYDNAFQQMYFMRYKEGRFGPGLILMPHPCKAQRYLVGKILGTFEDDMTSTIDDNVALDLLKGLFDDVKTFHYILVRFDISRCKTRNGVAGTLPP